MVFCISAVSVVISPFSFIILVIWVLSLLFLVSLARGLSILFTLSKNQLWILLIFFFFFLNLYFIDILSDLYDFLPSANFRFFCFSFSNSFRCWVWFSIWDFSSFLRKACVAMNFPLSTAFVASHQFWVVVSSLSFVSRYFFKFFWI